MVYWCMHPMTVQKKQPAFMVGKKIGNSNACEDCAPAKVQQENLEKMTEAKSTMAGDCLMMDMSSINRES
jgi:hypothetical protein